jgi:1,4-dihydroxy-2-naphthoate octaprenyltransferase
MPTTVSPRASDARLQARAYLRMGRTIRYENWLGTPLWWTSLPAALATEGHTLLLAALTLAAYMAMVAVAGTLDDVQGLRDGSDRINYERSDPTGRRPMTRKPLLLGWATEAQAVRYAAAAAVSCCGLLVAAWLVGTAEPTWWLPAYVMVLAAGFQYSSGLKLSYIGAQELLLAAVVISSVVFPFLLVTGHLPAMVTVTAIVFALWFVQVSMCSNSHDVDGDRSVGRRTFAALGSDTLNRRVVTTTFLSTWALVATATLVGWWSPWQLLAVAPAAVLHARQLRLFLAGDPLHARAVGFLALRVGVAGLALANLGVR